MAQTREIRAHAGLRGVAALLVVAYHLQFGGVWHLPLEDATPLPMRCYLFVDLFFVLSGFILSYVNAVDRRDLTGVGDYRTFLLRRLIRLYPLLCATLLFMVVERALFSAVYTATGRPLRVDWSADSLAVLAGQFLMLNAWLPVAAGWNVPTWSISAEVAAYLLFPALAVLLRRRPQVGAVLLGAASLGFYAWVAADGGSLDIIGGLAPLRCLAGFALGMLIYRWRDHLAALPEGWLTLVQLAALAAIIAALAFDWSDPLAIPAFVLLVAASWTDRGRPARLLGGALPYALGQLSYSIYLVHVPVIEVAEALWREPEMMARFGLEGARLLFLGTCLLAVLLVARLTFAWIEVPARRRLGERLLHRRLPPITRSVPAP